MAYYIVLYLNVLFWLFPPFKQFKKGYFYYFVLLGISNPIVFMLFEIKPHNTKLFYLFFSFALLLIVYFYLNKISLLKLLLIFPIFVLGILNKEECALCILILHMIILYNFLLALMKYFEINEKLSIYFIVLILYECTIVAKMVPIMMRMDTGMYFFTLTASFDILIAVYFIFFNLENSPKINFKEIFVNEKEM